MSGILARRRGACPSLPEPMMTGDGLLARLVPLAPLTPAQLAGLARAALACGNGIIEVSARGSVQVRGLTAMSAPAFAGAVDALGIGVRAGLALQANPLAGRLEGMAFDPRALAAAIAEGAAALDGRLAPKLAVIVDGGGPLHLHALAADIRLVAVDAPPGNGTPTHRHGTALLLSLGGAPLGLVRAGDAAAAVAGLLEGLAARGPQARASDIPIEEARAALGALVDVGSAGRAGGGADDPAVPPAEPVGVHRLADGTLALGIGLPFGASEVGVLVALADAAAAAGAAGIEPAPGRALLLAGLAAEAVDALRARAAALGFIVAAEDPRRRVFACPGSPACGSARLPSRSLAAELAPLMGAQTLHVSGCAKGCAHPGKAHLTIVGLDAGAGLVVEGTARDMPARIVPASDLTGAARLVLETPIG